MGVWSEVGAQVAGEVASQASSSIWDVLFSNRTNQINIQNWERQNAYNDPKAQMRRYQEAGLNPALMYGQGNPGNAGQLPSYNKPTAPKLDIPGTIGKYTAIEATKANIENVKADTIKKLADAEVAKSLIPSTIMKGQSEAQYAFNRNEIQRLEANLLGGKLNEQKLDISYKEFRNRLWEEFGMTMSGSQTLKLFIKLLGEIGINPDRISNWVNEQ